MNFSLVIVIKTFAIVQACLSKHRDPYDSNRQDSSAHLAYIKSPRLQTDPSLNDNAGLRTACSHGNHDLVRLLLEDARVDPTVRDNVPIKLAAQFGHVETVRLLLNDPRIDPTASDSFPLRVACEHRNDKLLQLLLEDGRCDPNAERGEPLRLACETGKHEIVKLLLSDGRAVVTRASLEWALVEKQVKVCRLLVIDGRILRLLKDNADDPVIDLARLLAADRFIYEFSLLISELSEIICQHANIKCLFEEIQQREQNLVCTSMLIDKKIFRQVRPTEDYGEYLLKTSGDLQFASAVLYSRSSATDIYERLIARAVRENNVEVLKAALKTINYSHLLLPHVLVISASSQFSPIWDKIDECLHDRMMLVDISEHGRLPLLLALWMIDGSYSPVLRFLPLVNIVKPTALVRLINGS